MFTNRKFASALASFIILFSLTFSGFQPPVVSAQGQGSIKRQVNADSGRVSFIGPESGLVLLASEALGTSIRPSDPAMALAKRFGSEFGLKTPERELSEIKTNRSEDGRVIVRYQQTYQGIPVMGGELIVNTNDNGDLYSMSGEVSPNLSLQTQPKIDSAQAHDSALQVVAKYYQKTPTDFVASEPELWIFDESLLQPSKRPVELVWRMEVTSVDKSLPVRELVLVNTQRGGISLHFNQVDTAWAAGLENTIQDPNPIEKPSPIETPFPNETPASTANTSPDGEVIPLVAVTWYVATTGNDANTCTTTGSPCLTINGAIGKAADGDTIKVATGTYTGTGTEVVLINKSVTLSGGWNASFTTQSGSSTIDGQGSRPGVVVSANTTVSATVEHFVIQNGLGVGVTNNYGLLTLNYSIVTGNTASYYNAAGGGIANYSGTITLNNSTVSANSSSGSGGGINNTYGTLTLNNSSVINNSGSGGGGIYAFYGTVTINNSTISGNIGGGISVYGNTLNINNSTIAYNSNPGGQGGGISSSYINTINLRNSILANNTAKSGPDCYGGVSSASYNIIGNTTDCTYSSGVGDKINVNPQLFPLLSQGYHPLLSNSPAINSGNPATCLPTDQRGVSRVGTCDIGAYEYTTPSTATSLSIVSGSGQRAVPTFAFAKPLKVAVLDIQGSPVLMLNVNISFTAPVSGASGTFAINGTNTTSVLTDADGIATTSTFTANSQLGSYNVSASASGLSTVNFNLENAAWYVSPSGNNSNSCSVPASPCLTIDGASNKAKAGDTILVASGTYSTAGTGGYGVQLTSVHVIGGWDSAFTIQNGNSIIDGEGVSRGITVNGGATAIVEKFTIKNGAGGIVNLGTLTLLNSSITNSSRSDGGGIYNNGALTISNSTLSNNHAYFDGGGIYNDGGILTVNNVTVSDNHADSRGGGIFNNNGITNISNSILASNTASYWGLNCNSVTSQGYNIIDNTSNCAINPVGGDQFNVNPKLDAFVSAQGYYPVQLGSPAIDAGNITTCSTVDQLGVSRPQGFACDIGAIEYPFNHSSGLLLKTYNTANSISLPGTFLCDQTDLTCVAGDSHAKAAHNYAAGTYNLYKNSHNRNSINGNGIEIISTVHYGNNYQNAFWNGYMMVYGDAYGFPLADDVVAHELTHGVTQYESNLFYFYQSGAINESFSDVWGEYYDQTNALGTDTPAVKWLMGEDVSGSTPIRSMSNPPTYGDPDKMSSANYDESDLDNGGVHTNSGVNNKAVFLMVDGGTFNSKTVSALGWDKTEAIYYEAQTNLLSSGADYSDLYYAIQQACVNLTGQLGITAGDCLQVKNALDAVEMNTQPAAGFNPDAPVCAAGTYPAPLFYDNMESGSDKWVMTNAWSLQSGYASSPIHMLYGDDFYPSSESSATMATGVAIPAATTVYLHFKHAFAFEYDAGGNYDGGVLEYSTNNGSTWVDASPRFLDGQNYKGVILNYNGSTNALKGRNAFVRDSHGYVSSRYNLSSLGGQTVKFRWRFATDADFYYLGWMVDDVQIYTCGTTPPPLVTSSVRANTNPAGTANVDFTVAFSQSVTGVDVSDFSLTTSGVSGAAVSGVSGSGSAYTVTVNTGNGSGTIQLNVMDNDSILNASSSPLGGSGAGNGNFTSGEIYDIDKNAPTVVSSLRINPDPTGLASVNFAVTFSEPVTHVDSTDFSLTTSGVLGAAVSGVSGSGSVYTVTVSTGSGSGTIHLNLVDNNSVVDAANNSLGGAAVGDGNFTSGETYTITKTWIFGDVPNTYWSWSFIERLYNANITGGCSAIPLNYCPINQVTRAQMAIFLVRAMHGVAFVPPTATGIFADVPVGSFGANFIEQLAADGITSGCGGGNFCPNSPVTRASMAIFLVRAKHGVAFVPPTATGIFTDVPVGSFGADFIEQLVADSITSGCGAGIYCPSSTVKRDSMAVFLVRTFNLP